MTSREKRLEVPAQLFLNRKYIFHLIEIVDEII